MTSINDILIFISFYTGLLMTGVIWTIQLVHYPSFKFISSDSFANFHQFHSLRISLIVIPIMILELISSLALVLVPNSLDMKLSVGVVILTLGTWAFTFLLSVPCHNQLQDGYNKETINRLVKTNWPRTILWSLKSILFLMWWLLN